MLKAAIAIFVMFLSLDTFSKSLKKCTITKTSFRSVARSELKGLRLTFEDDYRDFVSFQWDLKRLRSVNSRHLELELGNFEPDLSTTAFARAGKGNWLELSREHRIIGKSYLINIKKLSEIENDTVEILIPVSGLPTGSSEIEVCETWKS